MRIVRVSEVKGHRSHSLTIGMSFELEEERKNYTADLGDLD